MLAADAGGRVGPRELEEICKLDLGMWSNINADMIDWTHRLRASGLKVGVLSNMHSTMVTHCRAQFDWLKVFDFVTFSAEVRMIKPDAAIYEHTLRGLDVQASQALFLDDREINIQAARALGIHAIRVQSMAQLRSDLQNAGFKILPEIS
jgi:epoxide hydrolase-like predicted phosphatase